MATTLRRMFWLALIGGAGYAGWMAWQRRNGDESDVAPEWPPLDPPTAAVSPRRRRPTAATHAGGVETPNSFANSYGSTSHTWVPPVDGLCPDGYPIKANDNSGIFHVPGGRFYERTVPERCYADAADAEADGYRRAKSTDRARWRRQGGCR